VPLAPDLAASNMGFASQMSIPTVPTAPALKTLNAPPNMWKEIAGDMFGYLDWLEKERERLLASEKKSVQDKNEVQYMMQQSLDELNAEHEELKTKYDKLIQEKEAEEKEDEKMRRVDNEDKDEDEEEKEKANVENHKEQQEKVQESDDIPDNVS
jgi:GTP-binding protein EngB required for normal cell division